MDGKKQTSARVIDVVWVKGINKNPKRRRKVRKAKRPVRRVIRIRKNPHPGRKRFVEHVKAERSRQGALKQSLAKREWVIEGLQLNRASGKPKVKYWYFNGTAWDDDRNDAMTFPSQDAATYEAKRVIARSPASIYSARAVRK